MTDRTAPPRIHDPILPIERPRLADPLAFILADHARQRMLCGLIEDFADAPGLDRPLGAEIIAFLGTDMAVHVIDEEQDLFPLLRRRCAPEDEIESVLAKLAAEHGEDGRAAADIVDGICALLDGGVAPRARPSLRAALIDFARRQRRHLMVENSIVLPLARARLQPDDLANLARRMAARRGWAAPPAGAVDH